MGAGKTTTGRKLAKALKLDFVDSDHEIESRTGVDIPLIFEKEGEAGFRKREAAMIDELSQRSDIILATGGGAILDPDSRAHLRSRGTVIYLQTSVEQQLQRTQRDTQRPLLRTADKRAKLTELLAIRHPLYLEVADLVLQTDGSSSSRLSREIQQYLHSINAA